MNQLMKKRNCGWIFYKNGTHSHIIRHDPLKLKSNGWASATPITFFSQLDHVVRNSDNGVFALYLGENGIHVHHALFYRGHILFDLKIIPHRNHDKIILYDLTIEQSQIGHILALSKSTVSTHAKNIYRKLDAHSRSQAVYRAQQMKLL